MKRILHIGLLLAVLTITGCGSRQMNTVGETTTLAAGWTVLVRETGPRWLGADWWRAQNLDPERIDPDQIRLHQRNTPSPFLWVESDSGPGLLFYGAVEPGRLGPSGGYTLAIGENGMRIIPDIVTVPVPALFQDTTLAALWLEEDNVYRPTAPDGANWLWTSFNVAPVLTRTLFLTEALSSPVTLTLRFWGQSSMPQDPDHHIRVLWNGTVVDDHFWNGNIDVETWTITVPSAQPGENTLVLISPGDTGAPVEVTWLDSVEVTWRRALTHSGSGWETWLAGPDPVACWTAIPEMPVAVMLVGQGGEVRGGVNLKGDAGRLCVAQRSGDRGWLGVPDSAPLPDITRAREVVSETLLLAADYLIIAPRLFHDALAPLITLREADGLAVALVTPETLYDGYGTGVPDEEAIRSVVADLHARGKLRYLLLVGDASANPAAIWSPGSGGVPTGWGRTVFVGDTPSDHALVTGVDGDPLIAVGRFPASTVDEVHAMVAKTLAWQPSDRILMLNDDEAEFVTMSDALAAIQSPDLRLDAGDENVRRDLLRWLKDGPGVLVYSGHGSLPLLGDEKLLTVEDAGAWDGPTVVVAWTCLCAGFTHPTQSGLSEAWLRDAKGTVAFVGPTGETTTGDQSAMAMALHRALAKGETLGDALLAGWRASTSKDAEMSFVLLGDPALRVVMEP